MARDIVRLSAAEAPPMGREQCWTDNREPELAEMLDDTALQAVMARDGVTRQAVERLVGAFHRTGLADRSSERESDRALPMNGVTSG